MAIRYLNRLGLDLGADERAIRRAYARELKQIDLETDAAGFQALRHAYEMALQWVRHKPAGVSFAPAATVPVVTEVPVAPVLFVEPALSVEPMLLVEAALPVEPAPSADPVSPVAMPELELRKRPAAPVPAAPARDADTGESPLHLAQAVFDEFLVIYGEMNAHGNASDSLLQRCASDDRLLNITARAHFEFLVARLLADGWQPGHEGLFAEARQVFAWDKDRRRLMEFDHVGMWLNQAIDESEMFTHQQNGDCSGQADAVERVRADAAPSKRELMTHAPHLRNMVMRFPAWTAVIASSERIAQWIEMEQAIPGWRRRMQRTTSASSTEKSGGFGWWKVFLFLMVVRACSMFSSHTTSNQPPPWNPPRLSQPSQPATAEDKRAESLYQHAAGDLYISPGMPKLDPLAPLAQPAPAPLTPARAQKNRFLNGAEMQAISKLVRLQWPHAAAGTYKVEFNVELDDHGGIANLTKQTSSGLPAMDSAVEDAIFASAPFDAQIRRRFRLVFTNRPGLPMEKAAQKAVE